MDINFISRGSSAWFSSSVPRSKVDSWVESNGRVEPDPFQADMLFADHSEADDVKRVFRSKEFLAGHLTVFHSDLIPAAAKQEVATDVMNFVLLPWDEFDELGISLVQCLRDNRGVRKTHGQSSACPERTSTCNLIHTSTPKNSESQTITKKYSAPNDVPRSTRTKEKINTQKSTGGNSSDDCISEFSTTTDTTSVAETPWANRNAVFHRNCPILHHRLLFDMPHLDVLDIPCVKMMDYDLEMDGCHAERIKKTKLHEKYTS